MKAFYHSIPVQIRFNDVDMARHVNNSAYNEFFDLGRLSYFRNIFGRIIDFNGTSLVIASIRIDFFQPVFIDDLIKVHTKVVFFGNKSLEMLQEILREGETEPTASSTTVMVCFDYNRQVSEVLPMEWKQKINEFEHNSVVERGS
jgi:acyl-CoA thioester hydrolase